MSDATSSTSNAAANQQNDNVMAAVATIPLVGLIIYYGVKDTSELVKFYAKQSIGLLILSIVVSVASFIVGFVPFIGWVLACLVSLLGLVVFVAWVILLINALQGKTFRLPLLSDLVDQFVK